LNCYTIVLCWHIEGRYLFLACFMWRSSELFFAFRTAENVSFFLRFLSRIECTLFSLSYQYGALKTTGRIDIVYKKFYLVYHDVHLNNNNNNKYVMKQGYNWTKKMVRKCFKISRNRPGRQRNHTVELTSSKWQNHS
jgi:hypothetical protein